MNYMYMLLWIVILAMNYMYMLLWIVILVCLVFSQLLFSMKPKEVGKGDPGDEASHEYIAACLNYDEWLLCCQLVPR